MHSPSSTSAATSRSLVAASRCITPRPSGRRAQDRPRAPSSAGRAPGDRCPRTAPGATLTPAGARRRIGRHRRSPSRTAPAPGTLRTRPGGAAQHGAEIHQALVPHPRVAGRAGLVGQRLHPRRGQRALAGHTRVDAGDVGVDHGGIELEGERQQGARRVRSRCRATPAARRGRAESRRARSTRCAVACRLRARRG